MQYGLALAGGGTRGAAHVGVLKALEEEGLLPSSVAGTSAGSIVAGLYASGMSITEMQEVVTELGRQGLCFVDPDFTGLLRFLPQILFHETSSLTGLIKGNRLNKLFKSLTDGILLEDLKVKTVIPSVDIKSGNTIVFTNFKNPLPLEHVIWEHQGNLADIMMASSSVPGVFRPRRLGDYCLVDGGVTNNLPVDLLVAAGEQVVVAVDLGVDYEMPHDHSIVEILSHSFTIMSKNLKDCKSSGEVFLLNPPLPKGAGLLTFERMVDCMEGGYHDTKMKIPLMKKILEKREKRVNRIM